MNTNLTIENYSDKSFVVRGETKPHKDKLKELQGKWNGNLTGGGGWIFSNKHREAVEKFVNGTEENEEKKQVKVETKKTVSSPTVTSLYETVEKEDKAILTQGLFVFIPSFEDEDGNEVSAAKGKFQSEGLEYWVGKRPDFSKQKTELTLLLRFSTDTQPFRMSCQAVVVNREVVAFAVREPQEDESEVEDEF